MTGYSNRILAVCKSCVSISDLCKYRVTKHGFSYPFLHWARRNPRRYHAFSWGRDVDRSFLFLITARFPSPLWSPKQSLALHYSVIARCRRIRNIRPSLSTFDNIIQHLLAKRGFADREFKVSGVFPLYPVLPTQVGLYVNIAKNRGLRTKRCTFTRCLDVMTFETSCRLSPQFLYCDTFGIFFYIFCCVRWRNKQFSLYKRLVFLRWRNLLPAFKVTDKYIQVPFNPSAWGHLNPSSYCDVGRLFHGVFKLWSKLQRKKWRNNF